MAENVIDTLKLDIIVNTKHNGQSITTLRNSLEKLYKFLNGVKDQDFSKVSNDIAKIGDRLTPLVSAVNSLNGQGTKNLNSLSNALKKIKEFTAGMATQDFSSLDKNLVQVSNSLTKFVSSLNSLDETGLKNIKTISSLSNLSSGLNRLDKTIDGLDAEKLKKKFIQMAEAIDPFITKVSSAKESLVALNGIISGSNKMTKSTTGGVVVGNKLGRTLNFGSMVAKLYFVRNITKQLGQDLAKVVQYGIDYEETLNLWQVAMKGNTAEARKFITEMNKAYGISEATLMNYQAIFKNMLSALGGVSHDIAYDLSELMTQMALDYASLYNVGIEESMTKFQAVLAGQVRPIRNESGYDITQATLFEVYKDIGGTKTVRQLSETEKRLLRILAVYRQMKDTAVGDLEKTITSSANQLRLMGDTVKDIATWIGVGANQWLQQSNILIRINAYLLALRELAKSFAVSMGYIEPTGEDNKSAEQKQTDNLLEGAEGTADAYEEANKQVDLLEGKLLGFDKFQVLSSAGVGETNTDIDKILEELQKAKEEYQGILDQSQNIALFGDAEKNIKGAYDILKKWGFELTDVVDENGEKVLDASGNVVQQWTKDGKTVKEILGEIFTTIKGIFTFIGLMTKPWLVFVFAIEEAYFKNKDFRNSMNEMLKQLGGAGLKVFQELAQIFISIVPIIAKIVKGFAGIIGWLDEMELLDEAIWVVVVALMAWKAVKIAKSIKETYQLLQPMITKLKALATQFTATKAAAAGMAILGFMVAADAAKNLFTNLDDMSDLEKAIEIFKILTGAALAAAVAVGVFHTSWSVGVAAGVITAGLSLLMGYMSSIKSQTESIGKIETHANGGLATKGSLFYAGEAGPELVTQTSGGGSTIMNMKQLEDAVARGFIRGFISTDKGEENQEIAIYVDGQKLFNVQRATAKRNGYDYVRV